MILYLRSYLRETMSLCCGQPLEQSYLPEFSFCTVCLCSPQDDKQPILYKSIPRRRKMRNTNLKMRDFKAMCRVKRFDFKKPRAKSVHPMTLRNKHDF